MSSGYFTAEASTDSNTCIWCSIPLDSENSVKNLVCEVCYNLLLHAGISDREVFQKKKKINKGKDK